MVRGEIEIAFSPGKYDWLGKGAYFWEGDKNRALEWAAEKANRGDYKEPFVIGAAIDLGNCLDLLVREDIEKVREAYLSLAKVFGAADKPLPVNKAAPKDPSPDLVLRDLDSAVINHLHHIVKRDGGQPYDTIRGLFREGEPLYPNGGFYSRSHSQIAVVNIDCIKGVFLPKH